MRVVPLLRYDSLSEYARLLTEMGTTFKVGGVDKADEEDEAVMREDGKVGGGSEGRGVYALAGSGASNDDSENGGGGGGGRGGGVEGGEEDEEDVGGGGGGGDTRPTEAAAAERRGKASSHSHSPSPSPPPSSQAAAQQHGFCGGAPPRYLPVDLATIASAPSPVELANDGDEEAAAASEASIPEGEQEEGDADADSDSAVGEVGGADADDSDAPAAEGNSRGLRRFLSAESSSAASRRRPGTGRSLLMTRAFVFGNRQGVLMEEVGCSKSPYKVPHENWGEGPKPKPAVKESEKPLVECIKGRKSCADPLAAAAARALPSMVRAVDRHCVITRAKKNE